MKLIVCAILVLAGSVLAGTGTVAMAMPGPGGGFGVFSALPGIVLLVVGLVGVKRNWDSDDGGPPTAQS